MNALYQSLVSEFESRIGELHPRKAYDSVSELALNLAERGLEWIAPDTATDTFRHNRGRRLTSLWNELMRGYVDYSNRELEQALTIAEDVRKMAIAGGDCLSTIDALHLKGRALFQLERLDDASSCFSEEMDWAQRTSSAAAFVRAVHEISSVQAMRYELLAAEFGFRLALYYYSVCFARDCLPDDDARTLAEQNVTAARNSLLAVSGSYMTVAHGPAEGDALLAKLHSPYLSTQDGTGDAFLELRGLATASLAALSTHQRFVGRILSRAMSLHEDHPRVSSVFLEEAEWIGDLTNDDLAFRLRIALNQSGENRLLVSEPFFKPGVDVAAPRPERQLFQTPETAAENAEVLYRYLRDADREARYVYRGQTREYPGPLIPSAFRSILTEENGRMATDSSDPLYARFSLRKCGRRFVGEYNNCFVQYSNPVRRLIQSGAAEDRVKAAFQVYMRIIKDKTIPGAQEGTGYMTWIDALHHSLSAEELSLFEENRDDWMLLINNFHRRQYRMDRLIELFDYTLGTTIAQQYGLSSEGLDATKNLDVALFFATRDSRDFHTVASDGIGVIYRFPFLPNDVASSPVQKYNYYTLPSIIDVKDVIYRFEAPGLSREQSRLCLDAYIGAHFIDYMQNPDLLFLPEGFFESTRIAKQHAVIVFPDEIREDDAGRRPGIGGIVYPKYRYIEDLAARDGVEKFCFRHTGKVPEGTLSITRESLWPRDDALLEAVARIILGVYRERNLQAKRLDLLDVGFDNEQFAAEAVERYWDDRPVFFNEQELLGAQSGAIIF